MASNLLKRLSIPLMVVGSIALGSLVIIPLLFVYTTDRENSKSKARLEYVVASLVLYFVVSGILGAFNPLLFLAIATALLMYKHRKFVIVIIGSVLAVASAFIPIPDYYILLVVFVIGLALAAMTTPGLIHFLSNPKREIKKAEDPILKGYDDMERELGLK